MGNLAGARAHDVDAVLVSGCGSGDLFELASFADTTAVDKADADVTREPSQGGRGAQVPAIVAELA